ncbi:M24 family metallopeptidase [Ancylobacter amanitiformis]|uniref:Xaa-Pro aminopeptidase n=1 Tax=Ancylobacter amanitiformis TaxID=217069 RepID=A0ABU0LWK3_9HYPH|nr:Xaa-Pro peptidase family protein [Ancylobacter amanitiformis]MDQ0512985.1 Xaa-Pro aminopeptidase [Ancylobacter amanitiformis]
MSPIPAINLASLARRHRARVLALAGEERLMVATSPPNVVYCSGYRSMGYDTDPAQRMAAVFTNDEWILVGPTADLWAAQEASGHPVAQYGLRYFAYRTFFFDDAEAREATATRVISFATYEEALAAAIAALAGARRALAIEGPPPATLPADLAVLPPENTAALFRRARMIKDADEIALLRYATRETENALAAALAQARAGVSELDLAAEISAWMIRAGIRPGFIAVTSGPRAAFADAHAAPRRLTPGDLLRIDIGGSLQGYWSDTARSAVVGEPSAEICGVDTAIVAGQRAALALVGPGVRSDALFHATVEAVRAAGLPHYRRHHVGHGLGLDSHEYPTLGPAEPVALEPGMVINVETPYYRPGWGGLMYEDTLVITEDGTDRLTTLDAGLLILPA